MLSCYYWVIGLFPFRLIRSLMCYLMDRSHLVLFVASFLSLSLSLLFRFSLLIVLLFIAAYIYSAVLSVVAFRLLVVLPFLSFSSPLALSDSDLLSSSEWLTCCKAVSSYNKTHTLQIDIDIQPQLAIHVRIRTLYIFHAYVIAQDMRW